MTLLVEETKKDIINKLKLKEWITSEISGNLCCQAIDDGTTRYYEHCKDESRIDTIFEMIFEDYLDNHYNDIIDNDTQYANLVETAVYMLSENIYYYLYHDCYDQALEDIEEAREFNEAKREAMRGDY